MDFIAQFIEDMTAKGNPPANASEIVADDRKRRYQLQGEKNAKSGSFQLRVDADFAVGWHRSFKEGVTHKWNAKSKVEYTPEQKKEWHERIARERAEQAQRIREDHDKAALKAAAIWAKATPEGASEYLGRKEVDRYTARFYKGLVTVPVYINSKLRSLQFIAVDGSKRFVRESELVGGYFSINPGNTKPETLVICEGFATGGTIHQATGFPVVVAFNAGNLKPVAEAMRKKFPDARIIIAADNDQWTVKPIPNPGLHYARQAAAAIGGAQVIFPVVANDDEKKRTDWNDIAVSEGIEQVKNTIMQAMARKETVGEPEMTPPDDTPAANEPPHHDGPPLEAYSDILPSLRSLAKDEDWGRLLLVNGEGKLKAASLRNAMLFLKFHPEFHGTFAYNEFHQNIMIVKCPPWKREEDFRAERLTDIAITHTASELEKYGLTTGIDKAFKAIEVVAHETSFHPARAYFNALEWDKVSRLHKWLTYYLGCETEGEEYLAAVGTKWLVAAVKRVFEPGCKFEHVLVIEGLQGVGKSTALRALATFGDSDSEEAYFTDSVNLSQIENKDTILKMQGSIIVELAELSGFSKKEDEAIKNWISVQADDARMPYAKEITRFSRQFILAATTNLHTYLKDPTGHRRYWPVLAQNIDMKAIRDDRRQLWAEAVHLYRHGHPVFLSREEEKLADIERHKRLHHDTWTDEVLKHANERWMRLAINGSRGFKVSEIMGDMGMVMRDRDDRSNRRITGILQLGGYENKPMWNSDTKKTERFWVGKEGE